MGNIRKNYSPAFKAEVVLELLREEKSIAEISSEYKVHTTQLRRWREQALSNLPQLFTKQEQWGKDKAKYEVKIDELYTEIGRLSTQRAWLKKKALSLTRSDVSYRFISKLNCSALTGLGYITSLYPSVKPLSH